MVLVVALTSVGVAASEADERIAHAPTPPTTTTKATVAATIVDRRLLKIGPLRRTDVPFVRRGRRPGLRAYLHPRLGRSWRITVNWLNEARHPVVARCASTGHRFVSLLW